MTSRKGPQQRCENLAFVAHAGAHLRHGSAEQPMPRPWHHLDRGLCPHHGRCLEWTRDLHLGSSRLYSLQSYKHANAGEGGLLVTNDPDVAAQAILYSGSWWLAENPCFKKIKLLNFRHPAFSHCPVPVDRSNRAIAFARDTNLQIRDERHPGFAPIWKIFVLQNQPAPIGGTEFSVKH